MKNRIVLQTGFNTYQIYIFEKDHKFDKTLSIYNSESPSILFTSKKAAEKEIKLRNENE